MKDDIPKKVVVDNFYFWFDKEKKEEYYATPLYLYNTNIEKNNNTKLAYISWQEKTDNNLLEIQSANIYFPYSERLGTFLLSFLNADFTTYEKAYKTFFFAYGFEILKKLDDSFEFELKSKYDLESYLKETNTIYNRLKDYIQDIQNQIINTVNYIYNVNERDELKSYTHSERYASCLIKHKGSFYKFARNDHLIKEIFASKLIELEKYSETELLELFKKIPMLVSIHTAHKSKDLSSICYAILEELSQMTNYPIKKCLNCGMYFIPSSRLDEIYCDYPKAQGQKKCRELGATNSYNERLKNNKALRRISKNISAKIFTSK